jgi:RHS repeat-associated protein
MRTGGDADRLDAGTRGFIRDSVGRYYDPATATFLTVDPIVSWTNAPYNYTNQDPVNETDLNGRCGDPESCEENLGDVQANADAKEYAGQAEEREAAREAAIAGGQLESVVTNPWQYRGQGWRWVVRRLTRNANLAGWDIEPTTKTLEQGVQFVKPGTGGGVKIRVMPGDPAAGDYIHQNPRMWVSTGTRRIGPIRLAR